MLVGLYCVLFCVVLASVSQAAPTTAAPGCETCTAAKALPCGVTNSYALIQKMQEYVLSTEDDEATMFETLATSPDYKISDGFYIFIYDYHGPCVSHGANRNFEGKNLTEILKYIDNPFVDGEMLHKNFVAAAETGGSNGGWVSYPWKNGEFDPAYQKIAYEVKISKFGKEFYAGVGYNELQWPVELPCTAASASDCAETNIMSIMGTVTSALRTAGTQSALNSVWEMITNKLKYRLDTGFYIFAYEYEGACVAHGANPAFVGMSLSGILSYIGNTYADGVALHMKFIQAANEGGGWVAYSWKNFGSESTYSKVAYIMKVTLNGVDYYFGAGYNNICGTTPLSSCEADARQSCLPMEALPYQTKEACMPCSAAKASPCSTQNTVSLLSRVQGELTNFDEITSGEEFNDDVGFYVFIYEFAGPCVAHGANGKFVGMTLQEILDMVGNTLTDGTETHNAFVAAANSGGGWVSYAWRNKGSEDIYNKIAYIIKVMMNGKAYYAGVGFNVLPTDAVADCTAAEAAPCAESNCLSIMGKAMTDMYMNSVGKQAEFNAIFADIDDQAEAVKNHYKIDPNFYIFMYEFAGPCVAHGANSNHVGKNLQEILDSVGNSFVDGAALHQQFIDAANKGGAWVNYEWRSNAVDPFYHKSAFVTKMSAYGKEYYLGSGYNNICGDLSADMAVCPSAPPKCGAESNTRFRELKIGGPIQMTGKFAQYGNNAVKAFEVWQDWVNSQPNLPYSVTLHFQDDSSVSSKSVSIAQSMMGELDILVAPYSSGASKKVVEAVGGAKPVLVWGGASESVFGTGNPNVFGTFTPAGKYMTTGLDVLYEAGARTVLFVQNSKTFSKAVCDGAIAHAKTKGFTIVNNQQALTVANDASDVTDMLDSLSDDDSVVDIVVGCGHIADITQLVLDLPDKVTYKAILATQAATASFLSGMKAQNKSGCGLLMPTQWAPGGSAKDPVVGWTSADFVTAFSRLTGAVPSYQTASAAGAAIAVSNAISAAGSAEDMEKVAQAMQNLDIPTFYGSLKFGSGGIQEGKPMYTVQNKRDATVAVVAPSDVAVPLAYPDTCPAADPIVQTVVEEETPGWVIPVIIVCAVVVLICLIIFGIMLKRVMDLYKCIDELRKAGVSVQRPSIKDAMSVATGRVSGKALSQRMSQAAQL